MAVMIWRKCSSTSRAIGAPHVIQGPRGRRCPHDPLAGDPRVTGSARRIWGLMYRHLALYRRSWPRLLELAYWPVLGMCIWGFTASFLTGRLGAGAAVAVSSLLGGVLLWEVCLRSQMGMAISFLEELWSRNLGHVFVSPLRPWELVVALIGMSMIRMTVGVAPAVLIAWALYAFN